MGEEDAAHGCIEGVKDGEDRFCGGVDGGVDEGEAVGFADEVAVHQAEIGELLGVFGDRCDAHGF